MKREAIILLIFLTGCMVGPNYQTPEISLSDHWISKTSKEFSSDEPLNAWWTIFQDPILDKMILAAEESNYDLLSAESHIMRARALREIAASSLFPQVSADINGTKTYFSKNGPIFAIGPAAGDPSVTTSPLTGLPFNIQMPQVQNLFNALFDASWELDLFGKTRRAIEQTDALIESAIEQKRNLLITLFAEVARNYIDLRSFQTRKQLLERKVALLQEHAYIALKQFEAGYIHQLQLEDIEASLANTKAELPTTISEIYKNIYTLSVLTGKLPETLLDELLIEKPIPIAPETIALGIRSDLLRRRPDVRRAERELAASTAAIGVAVASFFPTVNLLGGMGFQSLQLPKLFDWNSKTWAYGSDINLPIYQGGKIMGHLHLSRADQAAAAYTYQQTVLSAIQDAENSLIFFTQNKERARQYLEATQKKQIQTRISGDRFDKGLVNKIDYLESKKELIQAELTSLQSDTASLLSLVSLYKALGGGWEKEQSGANP